MIIGALLAIFFSSASDLPGQGFVDVLDAYIEKHIPEPDRRKIISSDVKKIEEALGDFSKVLKRKGKRLSKINQAHHSSRMAFEAVLADLNRERIQTQQTVLELRFKIKGQMTRGEWQAAFGEQ